MLIKEYPPITKDGKQVVEGSNTHYLVSEFNTQLFKRGKTSFHYFSDKQAIFDEEKEIENIEELPNGISFTEDFTPDDMMSAILAYIDISMDLKSKLAFVTQLHNYILNDVINSSSFPDDMPDDLDDNLGTGYRI
jgi:protein associated with RNAse G/E